MDSLQYNYMGKIWRSSPTTADHNSFFHSAFGTRNSKDHPFHDKDANFKRKTWALFLTYYSDRKLSGALLELLKKCFIANDKYKDKSIEVSDNYTEYIQDITRSDYPVLVEEIPLLATLENIRIILFRGDCRKPEVFNADLKFLGKYPLRNNNAVREVVICHVNGHFLRLQPYDQSKEINTVINKVNFTQYQNSNRKKSPRETPNFTRKKYYKKRGSAGIKGSLYQINLLTMVLLNVITKVENWRLSTEDEDACKFDDLIFEFLPSESAILLQAKYKENEEKKVTYEDLVSVNYNNEFSLPKYFFSYQKILIINKFKVQNIVICTNLDLDESVKKCLKQDNLNPKNILHFQGADNICYRFEGCCLPLLKQNIKTYYAKNVQNKKMMITDGAIKEFLAQLLFLPNYLDEKISDNVVEVVSRVVLSINLNNKVIFKDVHKKILDWFKEEKGRYLTEVEAKGFFCDIRSNMYCDSLKLYDISFKKRNLPFIFQNQQEEGKKIKNRQQQTESPSKDPRRISHIIPDKEYILTVVKIYQALPPEHKTKALFVDPDETIEVRKQIIDAFEVDHYTILVIVCNNTIDESAVTDMIDKAARILNKEENDYKHVVLIAEENDLLRKIKNSNVTYYETITDNIAFTDLETSTQEKLKKKKNINFQGTTVNLEELLKPSTIDDLDQIVDSEIIAKLAKEDKIQVGLKLKHPDNYYICRSFNRNGHNIPEENMSRLDEMSKEKVILIVDSAGMGKSTVLTSLELSIKRNYPHLWVIRFDLNNYTDIMKEKRGKNLISITELLNSREISKLQSEFEKKLFATRERIVLMLDGVDEISPTYTELVISLLGDSLDHVNLARIFVTTRPHLCRKLEELIMVQSFTLEPFSRDNQTDFLTKYWTEELHLRDDIKKRKCETYAKALIKEISEWIDDKAANSFAGIPLQTRMLAEVFQEQNRFGSEELRDWEGCKEFLLSDNDRPNLPQKINLIKLYEMFIDKKRDIFINEKSNLGGSVAAEEALKEKFKKCHEFHSALAVELIFDSNKRDIFSSYANIEWPIPSAFENNYLLRAGIVQSQEEKMYFIHWTFAEYFVAQSLIVELQCEPVSEEFQEFFVNDIIREVRYGVIRAFFDSLIQKAWHSLESKIKSFYYLIRKIINDDSVSFNRLAKEGCVGILDFFFKCIEHRDMVPNFIDKYGNFNGLCCTAANWGHLNVIECLLNRGAQIDEKDANDMTVLTIAARKGHLRIVKFMVNLASTDVNISNRVTPSYNEALQEAADNGHLDVVKFLVLEAGANVNHRDKVGKTALYKAANKYKLEIVKFLAEEGGADPDIKDNFGRSALHTAARCDNLRILKFLTDKKLLHKASSDNLEVVKFLVDKAGANVHIKDKGNRTPLHEAAFSLNLDIVKFLVDKAGANVNVRDKANRTPLHETASANNLEMVKFLVEKCGGGSVNIKDRNGQTPLHKAAFRGRLETVKFLVQEAGAKVSIKDKKKWTPLHEAAFHGHLEVVKFLVDEAGTNVNIKRKNNRLLLHNAASSHNLEIVKFLVEKCGVDVNIQDKHGRTALHNAALYGRLETVKFLVDEAGANLNIKDKKNKTPLHETVLSNNLEIVKYLVKKCGVDVNVQDRYGQTPLHKTVYKGNLEIVKFLVEKCGVDVNIQDTDGQTPLHKAVCFGHLKIAEFLVHEAGADVNIMDKTNRKPAYIAHNR